MNMVWHYTIYIQFNVWEMQWNIIPTFLYKFTDIIQNHFSINNFP